MNQLVLIVEDNPDQAYALSALLTLSGLKADTAGTLAAALARLGLGDVACVLLDLQLPDASRTEGISAITAAFPTAPIVVLTGAAGLEQECLYAGAQEVVSKLADVDEIKRAVRCAVARHQVRQQYRPYAEALDAAVRLAEEGAEKAEKAEQKERPSGVRKAFDLPQ